MPAKRFDRASVVKALRGVGLDVYALRRRQVGKRIYRANRKQYLEQLSQSPRSAEFPIGRDMPCILDRFEDAGTASGQYFHQDLLVAQWIHDAGPARHVDVGSRIDGFVAHVAAFRKIEVLDIRPLTSTSENIEFHQRDITKPASDWDASCESLSCLHALEHFGLGRYGDAVDVDGWRRGWENLVRMVAPGGIFYFSTPIGPQRVEFDAQRVFSVPFLLDLFAPDFVVERCHFVDDAGELHGPIDVQTSSVDDSFGCTHGCGIFALRRR